MKHTTTCLLAVTALLTISGCGTMNQKQATGGSSTAQPPATAPEPAPTSTPPGQMAPGGGQANTPGGISPHHMIAVKNLDHVVIVVEENKSYNEIIGNSAAPYINSLAQQGALFTNYHGVEHPSQPNYLDLFSGSNQGVTDDSCPHTFSTANLASELLAKKLTFAGYAESLPAVGSTVCSADSYARKHAPWVNFTNVPSSANKPFTSFSKDFSQLPTVSFVIPNLDHDMHNGTIAQGDAWLKANIDPYVQWAKTHNSLLIVTWDEDDNSQDNHIPTFFVGPMVGQGQYKQPLNHFNLLSTIENLYDLPLLGKSASYPPIPAWGD